MGGWGHVVAIGSGEEVLVVLGLSYAPHQVGNGMNGRFTFLVIRVGVAHHRSSSP
jgi:hypothetical protein